MKFNGQKHDRDKILKPGVELKKENIALVKALFFNPKVLIFFLFLHENICCPSPGRF